MSDWVIVVTASYPWLFVACLHYITSHFSHYFKWLCINPFSIPCILCSWVSCNRLCLRTRRPLCGLMLCLRRLRTRPSTLSAHSSWHSLSSLFSFSVLSQLLFPHAPASYRFKPQGESGNYFFLLTTVSWGSCIILSTTPFIDFSDFIVNKLYIIINKCTRPCGGLAKQQKNGQTCIVSLWHAKSSVKTIFLKCQNVF